MSNNQAFVFSINNDYSFALANVLMSLRNNIKQPYNNFDFIVYHDGIIDHNQQLLKKICKNIYFINFIQNTELPIELYNHTHTNHWGKFIFQKLNCFKLLSTYERVLWLDVDILINDDISDIFNCNEDMAWRNSFWQFRGIFNQDVDIDLDVDFPHCNGGVIYFNKSIANKVTYKDILYALNNTKNGTQGSIDERIITYIAFSKKFNIKVLPAEYNAWPSYKNIDKSKIIHFINKKSKPWINDIFFRAFPEWGMYYKKWIQMGGVGPLALESINNFFSNAYTIKFITYASIFLRIIKNLDIIKNTYIYTDFNFPQHCYQFFIYNIPHEIHYELISYQNMFKVCLHIENKNFISERIVLLLKEIKQNIDNIITGVELTNKEDCIKFEILSREDHLNFTLNILVEQTLKKLLDHFVTLPSTRISSCPSQ